MDLVNSRFALAIAILIAPQVASADRLKVAVVPGLSVNLEAGRVDALTQDLADALVGELDIDAVGGLEVRRLLPSDGLPPDCVTNPACAADVAKRLGVSQLLFVVMINSGADGSVQVDPTWIEPSSGHSASRPAIDLTSTADADAKARFASVAHQLFPDAPVRKKSHGGISGLVVNGRPRHFTTTTKVTGAAAASGLALGITFGLITRSKYNTCNDRPLDCTQGQKDTISQFGLAADASFAIGTIAAALTVALYATSAESPHVVVSPMTEGGAAVMAVGSF